MFYGFRVPGKTHYFFFSTQKADGTPITLAGSPALAANSGGGGLVQFTTGLTLTVDYDGVTGRHRVAVDTSNTTDYPFGDDFDVYLSAGTVDSISVAGRSVVRFHTRGGDLGIIQAGTLAAGGSTTAFTLPSGRRAGVTVGMWLAVEGIGVRRIATYDAGTGAGTVSPAFASDPSSTFARVLLVAPNEVLDTADFASGKAPEDILTEIAAVKAKTDALPTDPADQSLVIAATDAIVALLGTPAGASIADDIANIAAGSGLNEAQTIAAVNQALVAYNVAKPTSRQGQNPG